MALSAFVRMLCDRLYNLPELLTWGGYVGLGAIVFAETGLFFGFFLPGDSLLVTAGLLAASGVLNILYVNVIVFAAAVSGDAFGYYFGRKVGRALFSREDSRFFKRKYVLKTKAFYDQHGGKTIVLARFIPIIRTFAPIVAGTAGMTYRQFAVFNVFGGLLWTVSMTSIGYFFIKLFPNLAAYVHVLILVIIVLSFVPMIVEYLRGRRK